MLQEIRNILIHLNRFGKIVIVFFTILMGAIFALLTMRLLGFEIDKADISTIKITQTIETLYVMLLPSVICGYLLFSNPKSSYHLERFPKYSILLLTIVLMITISPFIGLLSHLNEQIVLPDSLQSLETVFREMEENAKNITEKILKVYSFGGLLSNIVVVAILPAISEELLFRGTLLGILQSKNNRHIAIWTIAIVFSLLHFQMYGFVPRMVLGALFGYLVVWSKSIWLPIIAHFTNNAFVVLVHFFEKEKFLIGASDKSLIATAEKNNIWLYGIISLIISIIIIGYIRYKTAREVR